MSPLNPGIARTVAWLKQHGFETCDSGDGKTHDFACDLAFPYVHIRVYREDSVIQVANRLARCLGDHGIELGEAYDSELVANPDPQYVDVPYIEASYNPISDVNVVSLYHCDDAVMWPAGKDPAP